MFFMPFVPGGCAWWAFVCCVWFLGLVLFWFAWLLFVGVGWGYVVWFSGLCANVLWGSGWLFVVGWGLLFVGFVWRV